MASPEQDTLIRLIPARRTLGGTSVGDERASDILSVMVSTHANHLKGIENDPSRLVESVKHLYEARKYPRPILATSCVYNIVELISRVGEKQYAGRDFQGFIATYDFAFGMWDSVGPVAVAQTSAEELDQIVTETVEDAGTQLGRDMVGKMELFLYGKRRTAAIRELFQEDPTGFKLVDETVKMLLGEPSQIPRNPIQGKLHSGNRFLEEGAKAGGQLYKAAYQAIGVLYR